MTFRQYLSRQQHRDDPVGDAARELFADPRLAGLWSVDGILSRVRVIASSDFVHSYERAAAEYEVDKQL